MVILGAAIDSVRLAELEDYCEVEARPVDSVHGIFIPRLPLVAACSEYGHSVLNCKFVVGVSVGNLVENVALGFSVIVGTCAALADDGL